MALPTGERTVRYQTLRPAYTPYWHIARKRAPSRSGNAPTVHQCATKQAHVSRRTSRSAWDGWPGFRQKRAKAPRIGLSILLQMLCANSSGRGQRARRAKASSRARVRTNRSHCVRDVRQRPRRRPRGQTRKRGIPLELLRCVSQRLQWERRASGDRVTRCAHSHSAGQTPTHMPTNKHKHPIQGDHTA